MPCFHDVHVQTHWAELEALFSYSGDFFFYSFCNDLEGPDMVVSANM